MFSWMKIAAVVGVSGALMGATALAMPGDVPDPSLATPPAPVLHRDAPHHSLASVKHHAVTLTSHSKKAHTLHTTVKKPKTLSHKPKALVSGKHKASTTGTGWKHHPQVI